MTFEELSFQFKTAKPLILLRAKSAPFLLSFLLKVFQNAHVTTIANTDLRSKLEAYLEDLEYEESDEELDANTLFDDYSQKAAQYIERWSNAGFLRKYPNDNGEDLHELTSDTAKVLAWLQDLQKREHVGTNSRFRDIFSKLQHIVEQSTESAERRIEELKKKKWEIEQEINLLEWGKKPEVINDTDIKEQFYDLNKMARELLSDFAEVEQNFEQIRKDIQRKYSEKDAVKGLLLLHALDGLDEIEATDQGRSFKAFWEFLIDDKRQQEYIQLTDHLYRLLKERGIEYNNDRFLKNLKRYLHASGRKVIDANRRLSEKLSRVLSEKNLFERKRAMELIGEIRELAHSLTDTRLKTETFLEIEYQPYLNLFDRWELTEEKNDQAAISYPDARDETAADVDFAALFDQFAMDKKRLALNIHQAMSGRTEITLKQVVDIYGTDGGLSEIVGYFSIASENPEHIILEETIDPVWVKGRKVNVPMVIYTNLQTNHAATA